MNLYNVLLNNKISLKLLENSESENVIYCKSFQDHLFNVGVFYTKHKEIILEYKTEANEKYIVADVTFENGECYKDVRFRVVIEGSTETPYSTINLASLGIKTHVQLPVQHSLQTIREDVLHVEREISEDFITQPLQDDQPDYSEVVQNALNLEKQLALQKQQLNQQKRIIEFEKQKAQVVLEKASAIEKEIYEKIKPELDVYKNKLIAEFQKTSQKDLDSYVLKKLKEDFDVAANIDVKIQELVERNKDVEIIKEELKTYIDATVNTSLLDAKNYARKILDLGGGGGSVAVQYARGGTMNGNLNVTGQILSGGRDISNYFGSGSGGSGDPAVNTLVHANSGLWNSAYTNLVNNSAAYLSGYDLSSIATASGFWNSNYTTTNTNSANWSDTYQLTATSFIITGSSKWAVNTLSNGVTATLPASPSSGITIKFLDANKTWATNNLVLLRSGQLIESLAENLNCDISGYSFSLTYVGGGIGWRVY